jgi:Uma2 family endonuclease
MTTTGVQTGMPLEAYLDRIGAEGFFEIIDGQQIRRMPNVAGHHELIYRLMLLLNTHLTRIGGGGYVAGETPYITEERTDWVKGSRAPDVLYFTAERWAAYVARYPDWRARPFLIPPDLAIEVISPTDRFSQVSAKARVMIRDGVRLVWLVDPFERLAYLVTESGMVTIEAEGALDGGDVLPGFAVALAEVLA